MAKALIDTYDKKEFERIVQLSTSWKDLALNLGYKSNSGDLKKRIEKRVKEENINISHFQNINKIVRTEENIFVKNSTANQTTLRKWYLKKEYTEYKCSICGQLPEWNNKPLTLILDHINGINNDDRIENLRWVCPNCNQQLDTTGGRNIKVLKKNYYCEDCGKEVSSSTTKRCQECANKAKVIPIDCLPVTREELKLLIRTKSFLQIGKIYNISDNMVRKWCDKFNLPRKKTEIKGYSDKEWELI